MITMNNVLWAVLFIVLAPLIGGFLDGVDRVITARMQGRQGPPVLQPFYDVYKLLNKQTTVVNSIQILFIISFLIFTVFTGAVFFIGGDLLLVFFALSMAEIMLILAAFSTNAPYSYMGTQRELVQMMSYEPMTLLLAIGFYLATGSFKVEQIITADRPAIYQLPGMFVAFMFILIIKLRKSPFDISTSHHAHQEMVKGITTDISGQNLALTEITEWYDNVLMLGFVALFFITKNPVSYVWAVIACIVVYFLETLIDNVFPRVKYMTMLVSAWVVTLVFTGARQGGRPGKFELAHGGTIFLDEIGEMSLDVQVKILRVLQEKRILRVGGARYMDVDVRVIAATNRELLQAVGEGGFRQDLYYRLNVLPINVPPLRERREDIERLARFFMEKTCEQLGVPQKSLTASALAVLRRYDWPGNARELENVIERAGHFCEGQEITEQHLPPNLFVANTAGIKESRSLRDLERLAIEETLNKTQGNVSRSARLLGVGRNTLYGKIKEYQIELKKENRSIYEQ